MADKIPARDVRRATRVALEHARISRLTLRRRGAGAVGLGLMPTLLAACGGSDDDGGEAPRAAGPSTTCRGPGTTSPIR